MKTQFTPGPWRWQIEYDRSVTVNSETERLARFFGGLSTDIPNARLIAAAPDLFAACEQAITLTALHGDNPTDEEMHIFDLLATVIRKARGE